MRNIKNIWIVLAGLCVGAILIGAFVVLGNSEEELNNFVSLGNTCAIDELEECDEKNIEISEMDNKRLAFVEHKTEIIDELIHEGDYACCLTKPCTYCIEKTPGHGEGAKCNCLDDIVNGRHPCGECIGEIMEGHGNKYLSKYFAKSIAEEMGDEFEEVLKEMMEKKYGISVEEQV